MEITRFTLAAAYVIGINLVTIFLFGNDKVSARSGAWRVRERTLYILALLGGSPAILLGMKLFRHKTRKPGFQMIFVAILLIQIGALVFTAARLGITINFSNLFTANYDQSTLGN